MTSTAQNFVTRRHPDADAYPATTDTIDGSREFFQVIDDADQNPGLARVLGQGDTAARAWRSAARLLGSKR